MHATNATPELDQFRALVFDCDGTLADTMPAHYRAWCDITRKYSLDFPEDRFYQLGGVSALRILQMLSAEQGVTIDAAAVAHEKEALFHDRYLDDALGIEPVIAIARAWHRRRPLAVATGGLRRVIERTLGNLGIRGLFDVIVSAEDVPHPKPAPDTYLEAARRLGIEATRCAAFEDTDVGLASARAAGMTAFDIRGLRTAATWQDRGA